MNRQRITYRRLIGTILLLSMGWLYLSAQKPPLDKDRFIDALMNRMTLEEKIGQLNLPVTGEIITGQAQSSDLAAKIKRGEVGGLFNLKGVEKIREVQQQAVEGSRLGIPLLFGMDVIHGYETMFPIPLALSCTWDMTAIETSARIAATEASADGICWTFSPMVDISRDPRWGRVSEGNGEDPFLGAMIAEAMIRGYQGKDLSRKDEIMACVKHFALYGASEAGRDYNTVDMSRQRMFNDYMLPYQAAVEAGVGSVMASFNEVDGVPATANRWLMTDVLRNEWGFKGFVVTDYTGIAEMTDHGIGNLQTVSARAINAGVDMDMVSEGFVGTLKKSVQEGKVSVKTIDTACRRILEAKYKLGLFADPYKYCDLKRPSRDIFTKAHRKAARQIAAESFVLLKNDNVTLHPGQPAEPLLPFNPKGNIAVIGPLGDSRSNMPGTWSVAAVLDRCPSLVEGLKEMTAGKAHIRYAKGSNLVSDAAYEERATLFGRSLHRDNRTDQQLLDEALEVARQSDMIIAALGESSEMSGESSCRTDLGLPDVQQRLLKALLDTGKPVVLVLFTGRPLTLTWEQAHVPAILNVWFGGSEAAYAIGDVLFGYANPCGKLTMTFPKNVGQIPLYYAHKNTGRPLQPGHWFEKFRSNYLDVDNEPLYPFGYGLSYTTFAYSDIDLSRSTLPMDGSLTAAVSVTNTGTWPGSEVVQLYIRDLEGSTTRPVKELKGFEKIFLEPGEMKIVRFKITPEMLRYYNYDLQLVAEPGEFEVMIGTNSRDVKSARFTLEDNHTRTIVLPLLSDQTLMDTIEHRTFRYFWEGAEPCSGLAPERYHTDGVYPQQDAHIITSGGSGFGLMALIAGIERGYITRQEGLNRLQHIVTFLEKADRFHGAFPHWWDGTTGKTKAFSSKDNGGDLVETAFLMQGLLAVQQYYVNGTPQEQALARRIDRLWKEVDWNWYRRGGQEVLYWHWSPTSGWDMNFPIHGYNECLLLYLLAAASPTHGIPASVYHQGWAQNGAIVSPHRVEGIPLHLRYQGCQAGPLFWAQYSFLGLNPHKLTDRYCPDYFQEMRNLTLVNRAYCIRNPHHYKGYGPDCWGLTASYSIDEYAAHGPNEADDRGVIAPTAALSSIVYTPEYSLQVMRHLYQMGSKVLGPFGFYDAFSETAHWYPKRYLAIDQGPIAVMIENYRTGLLWKLFMSHPDVQAGLHKLGFTYR